VIDQPLAPLLDGVDLEPTDQGFRLHRLPAWVRTQFPDPSLLAAESQPSGVVLTFDTAATLVRMTVHSTRADYRGAPRPRGRIDVLVDGELHDSGELTGGDTVEIGFDGSPPAFVPGPDHTTEIPLPSGVHRVQVWLPHNESLELRALQADAALHPVDDDRLLWVHHGSSISHGSNATSPTRIWPVVAARAAGVRLRNLGLGGNSMVDPFLARVIRDSPADVISVKLGINVVNADVMRRRAFEPAVHGFLDTIRDGHPDTPLVLVSPIHCAHHEDHPGPGTIDLGPEGSGRVRFGASPEPTDVARGQLDLSVVRSVLAEVVARRADPNLRHVEGTDLYGPGDVEALPLPDGLHPDTATHELIGRRFADRVFPLPRRADRAGVRVS
jgi:hypothetical protein